MYAIESEPKHIHTHYDRGNHIMIILQLACIFLLTFKQLQISYLNLYDDQAHPYRS